MGNKPSFKYRKNHENNKINDENEIGDDFFLEDWEIVKNKDQNIDNSIKFDSDLVISEAKKDPYVDYTVLKTIGEGSFGKVYLVKHKINGVVRAMKVIHRTDKDADLEVLNEINILKKIDHPNIVKIFGFFISKSNYYLLTEYCEGGDLFDLINSNNFTEMQVAYIMYQIFSAINYCHKMKIIHRDIKPENILISKNEGELYRVKICDFGTSQIFRRGDKQDVVVGSLFYIAPEVLNQNYNFKCDLWSCGVIMYILLTGKVPFGGKDEKTIFHNIKNEDYNKVLLEKHTKQSKNLINKLLEKDPEIRINAEKAINHKFFYIYRTKECLNDMTDETIERYLNNLKKYKCKSVLQETAIAYLIHNYPDSQEVIDACKLFNKIDIKGKGKISLEDFRSGLSILLNRERPSKDDEEIFENLDVDKNNYVNYEEFVRAAVDMKEFLNDKVLKFVFKYFDQDNKGEITTNEIAYIFKRHINSKDVSEALNKIISEVDEDRDGKIKYQEFCKLMKNLTN